MSSVIVDGYVLTLAEDWVEDFVKDLNGDGSSELINRLSATPLALAERRSYKTHDIDTSYLSRFDGTDYCQWMGRKSDGFFHPLSRIMKIIKAVPE
jgi:hypothetical protein